MWYADSYPWIPSCRSGYGQAAVWSLCWSATPTLLHCILRLSGHTGMRCCCQHLAKVMLEWAGKGPRSSAPFCLCMPCLLATQDFMSTFIPTTWTEESERSSEMWLLSFLGVRKHLRQLLNIKSKCVVRLCLPGFGPATGLWNVSSCRCVGCYLCMVCGRRLSCRTNINNMLWGNFPWELVGRNLGRFLYYQNYRTLP